MIGLDDPVHSLSFSADARRLLTAGDSTEASLWNLPPAGRAQGGRGQVPRPRDHQERHLRRHPPGQRPGRHRPQRRAGQPLELERREGAPGPRAWSRGSSPARQGTHLHGRRAEAGGGGRGHVDLARHDGRPAGRSRISTGCVPTTRADQRHARLERPEALITGSDDTTVRFWDLNRRALWGTFSAAATARGGNANLPVQDMDWVFYTPDGFFDASASGEELGSSATATRQTPGAIRAALSLPPEGMMLGGRPCRAWRARGSPPISIVPPFAMTPVPDTELAVTLGAADWTDVALYHNDRPIATGLEERRSPRQSRSRPGW